MEKKLAEQTANLLEQWSRSTNTAYDVDKLELVNHTLPKFHQWTEGKQVVAAFLVTKRGEESYYLLFIDWHRNENYYLTIYLHNKSTTVAELQRIVESDGQPALYWKYNPLKRDGKNDQRKAYFQQVNGSTTMQIPLPQSPGDVESFYDHLFALSRSRLNADRIVNVFEV